MPPDNQASKRSSCSNRSWTSWPIFLPEVVHELNGTTEKIPSWVATAIGPMGNREKLFIDARKDLGARVYRVMTLEAEELNLPLKNEKKPLTPLEALALVCKASACDTDEPVDIEFRGKVPVPMSRSGETFPAWAITMADKYTHQMNSIDLFDVYTGGLVTEEMPPK